MTRSRSSATVARDVAAIVIFVLILRGATFFTGVWDWDVGNYLAVAREVLHGHLPYVTAWEYRPPGLFFVIAAALAVFRDPGVAMAALGVFAVAATCLALYAFTRCFGEQARTIGIVAALFYATVSIEDDGIATNTEILIAPFLCWALIVVARAATRGTPLSARAAVAVGVLLAAALQMKLTVVPEAAFVVILAAGWARAGIARAVMIAGIAVLPFAAEALVYGAVHQLPAFLDANALATLRRAAVQTTAPHDNLRRILAQPQTLFPLWFLALLVPPALRTMRQSDGRAMRLLAIIAVWLCVEAFTIVAVREFNDHQFLQLVPPLALLGAYATVLLGTRLGAPRIAAAFMVVLSFGLHGYYQTVTGARFAYHRGVLHDAAWRREPIDDLAARVRNSPAADRSLFVYSENPIAYVLADAPLPTRFPFSFYLTDPEMWPLTNVDGRAEVARILAAEPTFILRSDSEFHVDPSVAASVQHALEEGYVAVASSGHDVLFERRKSAVHAYRPFVERPRGANTSMMTSSSVPGYRSDDTRT